MNRFKRRLVAGCFVLVVAVVVSNVAAQNKRFFDAAREQMIKVAVIGAGVKDPRVINAMRQTPRHEFVSRHWRPLAYEDMSLPIGDKQTISSPFIVAFMTEALRPKPTDRVLEIGTGSGYQAAVLSPLVQDVYTIEIVEPLGRQAAKTLKRLGYRNVHTKIGDGFQGWPENAPFDKVIVTCSPEKVPVPLVEQLKEGGTMIIPVGQRFQQTLTILRKRDGQLKTEALRPTLFVPMTGTAEDNREAKPDPKNPRLANSGFEQEPLETGFLPGWYYQRQAMRQEDASSPEGKYCIVMKNDQPGKPAVAMQGFPIDGREVPLLKVTAWVKTQDVRRGGGKDEQAMIGVTFYDENRAILFYRIIGPFQGTEDWKQVDALLRVPVAAREGILRIGLFGAVGSISFDDVQVEGRHR